MGKQAQKLKPSKSKSNAPPSKKRPRTFDPRTVPQRDPESLPDHPVVKSVASGASHAPLQSAPLQSEALPAQSLSTFQSRATRNVNEEQNYKAVRDRSVEVVQTAAYLQLQQEKAECQRRYLQTFVEQNAAAKSCCHGCGCPAKEGQPHPTRPVVPVSYISQNDTFQVDIPITECTR